MVVCDSSGKYGECQYCTHSIPHEIQPVHEGGFCDVTGLCGHVEEIQVKCSICASI